jgi:hypothetical protein
MKLDKEVYLLSMDIYIRLITLPSYKGNDAQTATTAIKQAVTYIDQWDAMQRQVATAATQAVEQAKPLPSKVANGERTKSTKVIPIVAPVKELRAKAKVVKSPPKQLRAKAKAPTKAKGKSKR